MNEIEDYTLYRKKSLQPMRPWDKDTDMTRVSISAADRNNGSPIPGDMIAHNPKDPEDQQLVAGLFFLENYEQA